MAAPMKGQHILAPVCYPLHGAAQEQGEVGDGYLFGEQTAFFAEAASHIWSDDAHLALWPMQELGQMLSDIMRDLGRTPHREEIVVRLILGNHPACLQREGSETLDMVALLDHMLGLGKGSLQVPSSVGDP